MERWLKVKVDQSPFGWPSTKAFQHIDEDAKANYAGVKAALRTHFEPENEQSHYRDEIETCHKKGWADFAEDLCVLSEKAYPRLQPQAHECLALTVFLNRSAAFKFPLLFTSDNL